MRRVVWVALLLTLVACSDETDADAGSGTDSGPAAVDSGPAAVDSGPAIMGCAEAGGAMCPMGLMCCSGVPYPTEGVCGATCDARSDRHAKEGFAPVDGDAVLERLAELEISEWSYRADDAHARHVGPMAQDFHAAFGVGGDDTLISQVDADGVLMASVQALHRRLTGLERDNAELREQNRALASRVRELEAR